MNVAEKLRRMGEAAVVAYFKVGDYEVVQRSGDEGIYKKAQSPKQVSGSRLQTMIPRMHRTRR